MYPGQTPPGHHSSRQPTPSPSYPPNPYMNQAGAHPTGPSGPPQQSGPPPQSGPPQPNGPPSGPAPGPPPSNAAEPSGGPPANQAAPNPPVPSPTKAANPPIPQQGTPPHPAIPKTEGQTGSPHLQPAASPAAHSPNVPPSPQAVIQLIITAYSVYKVHILVCL